ncbi:hypothetical protein K435DRAFT_857231 [Dendrothele bispora CBS 962.96]|uniref:Bromodomain associated domain-containing protein n=1 Tax=Dendrothele bispora (strain CBS 962.96) TaxID=1314807 RepID=A0A4S8M702_DENBC|nr:hypothetical protein K435DRAFT_857231 [Dendrothele bispora CBS 962.96]
MDGGAQKLLESVIHRTLHAHNFSRSSSHASLVLTDFLSRYLSLLSSTCAKYAQHAGRTRLNARDAMFALEELGVSIDELHEYGAAEGLELKRYALKSVRRVEDLAEFRAQLSEGLRVDHDDFIPLHYALVPEGMEKEEDLDNDEEEEVDESEALTQSEKDPEAMDIDSVESTAPYKRDSPRPSTPRPVLPLSPPSTARKRQRKLDWSPPSHVPDFLPPFPTPYEPPSPTSPSRLPPAELLPASIEAAKVDKPQTQPQSDSQAQALTSTSAAASDYFVQVPYSQSSLSSVAEWHLPLASPNNSSSSRTARWQTPQTEPSFIAAYHHILTNPPSSTNIGNPLRHKVAMALLGLTRTTSRWDVPDTLYSNVSPNQPRVAPIGPTYPIQLGDNPMLDSKKDKGKDFKYPAPQPRSVATTERLSQVVNHQGSRIPDLARHVLHPAILSRTSRLSHPGVLTRDGKQLTYGNGVPAPWNANAPLPDVSVGAATKKDGQVNGSATKDSTLSVVLPDARLYATWDHEPKDYRLPLSSTTRGRAARLGSGNTSGSSKMASGSGGMVSLTVRGRSASKAG